MGIKRYFEFEDFQYDHKHLKLVGSDEAAQFPGKCSKPNISDGGNYLCLPKEDIENNFIYDIPYLDIEDFGASGASSLITHGSSEEDGDPEMVGHFEDVSSSLDGSPIRIVPIGPDHQALIPHWDGQVNYSGLDYENNDRGNEEKYLGTCIIPMPDENTPETSHEIVGVGRGECCCEDRGSMRCVRQHVTESWEDLRSNLDDEKFVLLGLVDSGEEVSCEWNVEEENVFNEVVYSNPASAGKNFWRHLSAAFPLLTKGELVSYYFNVFMLQKRAVQNRSSFLDIDSDDDEWHGNMHEVPMEVQKLPLLSFGSENQQSDLGRIDSEQDEDEDEGVHHIDDGDVYNDGNGMRYDHDSQLAFTVNSCTENVFWNGEGITGVFDDFFGLQDDSCTSFDDLPNLPENTHGSINDEAALHAQRRSGKSCKETNCLTRGDDTKCKESKEC
ncbi:hypothetical protein SAY86_020681 [Trapa natans]|uniref:AT-rich interactive domain-containing protein 2 n=1 Tax=Trapa natans TaxID=22666 RepID=A0AAN7R4E9_TRANT|nr:hypothetical protein SAY86_020681 [Trapa natans]